MKTIQITNEKIEIELSKDELGTICNALNEVCNGIEIWEFDTRIGSSIESVSELLRLLSNIYKQASNSA